jgi:hypothetical protein
MVNNVLIYSLQKCGTHFISQILALILNRNCNIYDKKLLYNTVPLVENSRNINRRYFSTHPCYVKYSLVNLLPHKKIFMIRNPLDKLISEYFYEIYYRINKRQLIAVNRNLNRNIFEYCLKRIVKVCNDISIHIDYSKRIPNSILFDYNKIQENKKFFIKIIARDLVGVEITDEDVDFICDKTDIKKCSEYESKHRSFKVGRIQNGLFFRKGENKNYTKYLTQEQINLLKKYIPQILIKLYNI